MRTLVKVQVPVQRGNKAIADGSVGKVIGDFMERAKPEAAYFGAEGGQRTAYFVIDLKQSSDLPPLLEPVFIALDAAIEFTPVMNAEELKQGLSQIRL